MDPLPIEGAPPPVRPNQRWQKVVWPRGTDPLEVIFLSRGFWGVWTHYAEGHTHPCGGATACRFCATQLPRYMAFAPVYSLHHQGLRVVQLSELAARQLLPVLGAHKTLRGRRIRLQRQPGKRNAPVLVEDKGPAQFPAGLPAPFDPWHSVAKFWGIPAANRPAPPPAGDTPPVADNGGAEIQGAADGRWAG